MHQNVYYFMGLAYYESNKFQKSIELLKKKLEIQNKTFKNVENKNHLLTYYDIARCTFSLGYFMEAEKICK